MAEQEKIAKMNVSTNKTGRSSLAAQCATSIRGMGDYCVVYRND